MGNPNGFYSFGNTAGFFQQFAVRSHIKDKRFVIKNNLGMVSDISYTKAEYNSKGSSMLEDHLDEDYLVIDFSYGVESFANMSGDYPRDCNWLDTILVKEIIAKTKELKGSGYGFLQGTMVRCKVRIDISTINRYNGIIESELLQFIIEDSLISKRESYYKTKNEVHVRKNNSTDSVNYNSIRIIDPMSIIGSRWAIINGKARHLKAERGNGEPPGIYIFEHYESQENRVIGIEDITEDKLVALGLYSSKVQCETGNNSQFYLNLNKQIKQHKEVSEKLKEQNLKDERKIYKLEQELAIKEFKHFISISNIERDIYWFKKEKSAEITAVKLNHTISENKLNMYISRQQSIIEELKSERGRAELNIKKEQHKRQMDVSILDNILKITKSISGLF